MYKLILIDDDKVALRHLKSLFKWENFGFNLDGIFTDGQSAMDYIVQNQPDLVVTDIKMPLKDGLEIAEECFLKYPNVHFILISAYRDFSYAQKAIGYNVIDYITKPFNIPAFENALIKAFDKISSEHDDASTFQSTVAIQQNVFSHILRNLTKDSDIIRDELRKIDLSEDILSCNCAIVSVVFKDYHKFLESSWKYGQERLSNALSLMLGTSRKAFSSFIFLEEDTLSFICINSSSSLEFDTIISQLTEQFLSNIKSIFNLEIERMDIDYFSTVTEACRERLYANPVIEKAKLYISNNYGNNLTLSEIASHVNMSPTYFSAFFKRQTNENFNDYLKRTRLQKALEFLKNTDIPIMSVCAMVGYKNTTHFYNLIKEETGMTPKEYREKHGIK